MELEEMKQSWDDMSRKLEQQKIITDKIIMKMTKQEHAKKMRKIYVPEIVGSVLCGIIVVLILINFHLLTTWYFILMGVFCIALLLLLPTLSMIAMRKMTRIDFVMNDIQSTADQYEQGRKYFIKVQKLGIYLGFIFIPVFAALFSQLMGNENMFFTPSSWWALLPGIIVFVVLVKLYFRKYKKITDSAGEALNHVNSES